MTPTDVLLIGKAAVLADDEAEANLAFYGDAFARLPRETSGLADVTRFVGYQSRVDARHALHFLGVEAERLDDLAVGWTAWRLGDRSRVVWSTGHDAPVVEPIRWLWHSEPKTEGARAIGEFVTESGRTTWISANTYFRPDGAGAADDSVRLVEPDPEWPARYAEFADWLRGALGPTQALRIEHYGSTAIPGIPAKPIIDVLVEVPSFAAAKAEAMPVFNTLEWDYWWHDAHMLFVRRDGLMGARTHHVHLAPRGHRLWEGLAFRDHLRTHPDAATDYARLKRELAAAHGRDRERYTLAKTDFVSRVLAQTR